MVGFEHLNDGWECCVGVLKIALQVTINSSENLNWMWFFLYSSLPEYSEKSYKSISGISKKKISLKFSSSK